MNSPTTYSDWVDILEQFEQGNDDVLDQMNSGSFSLDAGTAKRFYTRLEKTYKSRKESWLNKFNRAFENQKIRNEDDFGLVLRNGKQTLIPLLKFTEAKGIPENAKEIFRKDLEDFIFEIKKSLKNNVKKQNYGEKIMIAINAFGLPNNIPEKCIKTQNQNINIPPIGRKIIF